VGASERTKVQTDQYTRSVKDLTASNPFELHGIFLDAVITSWRPYISYLSGLASEQVCYAHLKMMLKLNSSSQ
jgi:hypothetical protein